MYPLIRIASEKRQMFGVAVGSHSVSDPTSLYSVSFSNKLEIDSYISGVPILLSGILLHRSMKDGF